MWDQQLDEAGIEGTYTSLGSYNNTEIVRLVEIASVTLLVPLADVLR